MALARLAPVQQGGDNLYPELVVVVLLHNVDDGELPHDKEQLSSCSD
jgi:hypothetical protein